jgi:hypothetical protein
MENGKDAYVQIAEIEVDAVAPARSGLVLDGRGADGADYRLELHLDLPVSQRTQRVLAEILAQSELRIARRVRPPVRGQANHGRSAHPRASIGHSDSP